MASKKEEARREKEVQKNYGKVPPVTQRSGGVRRVPSGWDKK